MSRLFIGTSLAAVLLAIGIPAAWAEGTLTHMSGPVSVLKADGSIVPGVLGARASPGDTVMTGARGYVRMEMTDGGEMVLRPESQLKIDAYAFAQTRPAEDSFVFNMLKGGLRTVTGLIGKRGNRDAYSLRTTTATIGIRGTQFDLRVCQANCGALADGTYLAVRFGAVQTTNAQGTLAVAAGQVVHVPPQLPPVILPRDPGIGFTPPAVIPRLDERRKPPPAAAATPTGEQAKPAAGGSGQTAQTTQRGAQTAAKTDSTQEGAAKSEASGKSDSSAGGAKPAAQAQSGGGSGAAGQAGTLASASQPAQAAVVTDPSAAAAPPASPAAQPGSGPECVVQ